MSRNQSKPVLERILAVAAGLVLGLSMLPGCGSPDREERLEAASHALTEAREEVESARKEVTRNEAAVETAQAELDAAREKLREAKRRLEEAEANVDVEATDPLLFRSVQKRLLEDDSLEEVAIAARVEKGTVYLKGTVPDKSLRDRAVAVARSTPGVVAVESEIQVSAAP